MYGSCSTGHDPLLSCVHSSSPYNTRAKEPPASFGTTQSRPLEKAPQPRGRLTISRRGHTRAHMSTHTRSRGSVGRTLEPPGSGYSLVVELSSLVSARLAWPKTKSFSPALSGLSLFLPHSPPGSSLYSFLCLLAVSFSTLPSSVLLAYPKHLVSRESNEISRRFGTSRRPRPPPLRLPGPSPTILKLFNLPSRLSSSNQKGTLRILPPPDR